MRDRGETSSTVPASCSRAWGSGVGVRRLKCPLGSGGLSRIFSRSVPSVSGHIRFCSEGGSVASRVHRRASDRWRGGPEIDGRVDETLWSAAQPYSTFTQQEPNEGQPASEQTEIRSSSIPRICISVSSASTPSPTSSSSARAVGMPISTIPTHPDTPRHVQRRAERVRLRHQSFRDRVRGQVMGEEQAGGGGGRVRLG